MQNSYLVPLCDVYKVEKIRNIILTITQITREHCFSELKMIKNYCTMTQERLSGFILMKCEVNNI